MSRSEDVVLPATESRQIAVRLSGGNGPPVLFLAPGFGSRVLDPDPLETRRSGVNLVTVDRPGYGRSSAYPADAQPTLEAVATDLVAILEGLDLGPVPVIGWSAGAIAAAALAAWQPELVASLVLVAARAPAEAIPLSPPQQAGLEPLLAEPGSAYAKLSEALRPLASQPEACLAQFAVGPADDGLLRAPDHRDRLLAMTTEGMAAGPAGAAADMTAQFVSPWLFDPAAVEAPTSLFYGERDDLVALEHSNWWAAAIPHSTRIVVERVGHLVPLMAWRDMLDLARRGL